ncbi:hypothetical protein [Streptomyces reniochalinae]|uniref:Uncharacterized protein n=1 Tax=Streptomyces reniochalinae TaxID=2250578 RepID=A0A367E9J5_9ACTN|nr:hypothetical protein [Streptomyces reniochalinae]RCG14681.1 hypothetical protein DQ392_26560 [Streptomyces reniochalinae]
MSERVSATARAARAAGRALRDAGRAVGRSLRDAGRAAGAAYAAVRSSFRATGAELRRALFGAPRSREREPLP